MNIKKINIEGLLKDCQNGMELDCTIYDECTLDRILEGTHYPVKLQTPDGELHLTKYGGLSCSKHAKCVIFPKGKTTWEGFVPPCNFKDGDIVYTRCDDGDEYIFIFKNITNNTHVNSYIHLKGDDLRVIKVWLTNCDDKYLRLATEEERQKLFDAIKANGYKWNAETKTLEKLIEPKFKVGDRIRKKGDYISGFITLIDSDNFYKVEYGDGGVSYANVKSQDEWELVSDKFDITTLKPFESKVLVRAVDNQFWRPAIWGVKHLDWDFCCVLGGEMWEQCIPYEGNEHLLGKTDDCDEYYKTWE